MIKIQNTLTGKKEEFIPLDPPKVNLYACGVTVYDDCHIGHARSLYLFELIRNYLVFRGYKVRFVRNITDVDDKIINKARTWAEKQGLTLEEAFEKVRKTYIDSYYEDLKLMELSPADIEPKATDNIKEIVEYIEQLIDKGYAYEKRGSVYFSLRKFKAYGKLSGKKIDDLLVSVRIDSDPEKEDPLDFALWKKVKPDEPSWPSPWGRGRPGWHIECSVMSRKYLAADTLDIHGGGRDLVFPHHENELTQSEALTGKPFARFWIHHGLLSINKQKMSKSLKNFVTIKEIVKKYPPDILKLFYLQAHYGSTVDFSWEKMEEAKKAYDRIDLAMRKLFSGASGAESFSDDLPDKLKKIKEQFLSFMDDDFNTARALSAVFEMVNESNKLIQSDVPASLLAAVLNELKELTGLLGLSFLREKSSGLSPKEIEARLRLRLESKKNKDYARADAIRAELEAAGIIIEDNRDGTSSWRIK